MVDMASRMPAYGLKWLKIQPDSQSSSITIPARNTNLYEVISSLGKRKTLRWALDRGRESCKALKIINLFKDFTRNISST
jgi:hypothetical protein